MASPLNLPSGLAKKPAWVEEFQAFIMRGNVVDLAVGIIIGAAFTGIVNSLVKDMLMPLIGLLVGGIDFSNIFITLKGEHAATLAEAQRLGAVTLNVGVFLNYCINFLIVSFAIFWLVKALSSFKAKQTAEPAAEVVPTPTEALLIEIRDLLARRQNP
ncbi:large conductance mechanosensitive channel protein MscL [Granulibacter bethesdensis]|uniref:Large-conductance mechanosensitive channel n=2 Tax=Granulibacter bethesdensis TaxID=364410 RepID=Q0BSF3_GRABC|nr:large conductance mechanosensitive channel protein MscL [Granulibacter bethesdensis]ABI62249.1 Large-conductance mechanosensitive channel [Granulibacter bethesdensis CGDNIH1]AHJ63161.1 Large-conductance mechanosensitive channel [Granulibacter bethesdensis]AHJ66206.1 Large-conductance mechanosensitive channel [Granulibacter bethesdensis CGDNIH4]AHJ68844.1 Large-conductance mechanosensitive channel [Granulibacter bethesdensis]APH52075.1 Large-conductance mechanosensitive channel [Granulibacte